MENKRMPTLIEHLSDMGTISFADFMREALYHPEFGYYKRIGARRVGATSGSDFFTAEAIGPVFAALVVEASVNLVGDDVAKSTTFVEIGAEPEGDNVYSHACPPFAKALAAGSESEIPTDAPVFVFSNELFDAQPFHRVIMRNGAWRECGVKIACGRAEEVLLNEMSAPVKVMSDRFPKGLEEGSRLDLPIGAEGLMDHIAAHGNVIAIVAFDYGLDWDDIFCRRPAGTARSYRGQKMCEDILADPGLQDITCHIAWDGLENILKKRGFADTSTERQEAFFIRHSMPCVEKILKKNDPVECGKLRELLHPMRMGEIFQVLSAKRG
jgi:SAM-dependent MidA family methyltransferase